MSKQPVDLYRQTHHVRMGNEVSERSMGGEGWNPTESQGKLTRHRTFNTIRFLIAIVPTL
jgi:hypothetical protein